MSNLEAERGLLCAFILDHGLLGCLGDGLEAGHFYDTKHQAVYSALLHMRERGATLAPGDAVSLGEELSALGTLEVVGEDYLDGLLLAQTSTALAPEHARIVREKAFLRGLVLQHKAGIKEIESGLGMDAALTRVEAISSAIAAGSWRKTSGNIACNCCADVVIEPITWLWEGRLANGKLSLIAGEPGLGKSVMTMDLAARLSSGRAFPGGGTRQAPGSVVILSAEDGVEDTIVPRLIAAGADLSKITVLTEGRGGGNICIPDDIPKIHEIVKAIGDVRLIVVDPISAYLGVGKVNSHNNTDVRSALKPLSKMAADLGIPVVAVTHLNKGQGSAIQRVIGSIAFVAAARAVFVVTSDKEDESRCLVIPAKNNLAPLRDGFAYRLDTREVTDANGRSVGTLPVIAWEDGEVSISANDAVEVSERRPRGPAPDTRKAAEAWLLSVLQSGPVPKRVIDSLVKEQSSFSRCSVDRARTALGIVSEKRHIDGSSVVCWILPGCGPVMSGNRKPEEESEAFM